METADQGVTAPLNSLGRGCEDRDFQWIPRLPGNQNGVYMRWKSPQSPSKAQGAAGVSNDWCITVSNSPNSSSCLDEAMEMQKTSSIA